MNRNELQVVTQTIVVAPGALVGSNIPTNYTRYIYRVKIQSLVAAQTFTLGRRENGAGATTVMDTFLLPLLGDWLVDPDNIDENSAPIYKVGGPVSVSGGAIGGASNVWAFVDVGTALLTYWYIDAKD
jgi:hypothetical protein